MANKPTCAECSTRALVTETLCKDHYRESVYTGEPLTLEQLEPLFFPTSAPSTHHVSRERFRSMFLAQSGLCALCDDHYADNIDHDHSCCGAASCGRCVRGLVCVTCNNTLALVRDSKERLRYRIKSGHRDSALYTRAIDYLQRYEDIRAAGQLVGVES